MKHQWKTLCLASVASALALRAMADDSAANQATIAGKPDRTTTGIISAVDVNQHTLEMKKFLADKKFNLGAACEYHFPGNPAGGIVDLHPGQKVEVAYQDVDGVLVADSVRQEPMRFEGHVRSVDLAARTVSIEPDHFGAGKRFKFAGDCQVWLRNDKVGALTDIEPGNHVTLTYELPDGRPTAELIWQTSEKYTGTLTALDLEARTVRAKTMFGSKEFNLGRDCVIAVNGEAHGRMSDLKPDESLVFTFDNVNGVNVVNRIAPAQTTAGADTAAGN